MREMSVNINIITSGIFFVGFIFNAINGNWAAAFPSFGASLGWALYWAEIK